MLGRRSDVRDRRRTGGIGSGVAARTDGLRRHDQQRLRLRQRPGHGAPVHRHRHHQARSSAAPANLERHAGVAVAVVPDREAGGQLVEELLAYLPDHADEPPPRWPLSDPVDRLCPEAGELIPESSTGSYDVRKVIEAIVDDGVLLEVRARWAANVVTAFATIGGRPVGIVANQPMNLAGTLDIPASQKAARFVAFCDAFNIPLVTLVDTPGFYPGKDLEWRGMIRHGAQLVYAYGRATVPRVCVILRKSYGGAFIVMDSKTMGNDVCLAWPWAELAVMGAGQAAAILQRRASDDERLAFEADYAERLLNPYVAAERGYVDSVIDPAETRREVAAALADARQQARAPPPPQARQHPALKRLVSCRSRTSSPRAVRRRGIRRP